MKLVAIMIFLAGVNCGNIISGDFAKRVSDGGNNSTSSNVFLCDDTSMPDEKIKTFLYRGMPYSKEQDDERISFEMALCCSVTLEAVRCWFLGI